MSKSSLASITAAFCLLSFPAQSAPVTYVYTGEAFDEFLPGEIEGTTRVTGSITLPEKLPPDTTVNIELAYTDYPFWISDGLTTVTHEDVSPSRDTYNASAGFITDSDGVIQDWGFGVTRFVTLGNIGIRTSYVANPDPGQITHDQTTYCTVLTSPSSCTAAIARTIDNPGSWNVIPLPAAAWLFGSGLGLLGWMSRKTE